MTRGARMLALAVLVTFAADNICFGAYGDSFEEDYSYVTRTEASFQELGMKSADTGVVLPAPVKDKDAGKSPEEETPVSTSSEKAYGPGLEAERTEKKEEDIPLVQKERLKETYHEEFGVYEENLADTYFIYSNVANGGITDQAVYLDLPRGVTCILEKDGETVPYISSQALGETGAYVMKLTAPSDPGSGGAEPVSYQAVFRFRIQPKLEKKEEEEGMGSIERIQTFWESAEEIQESQNETENEKPLPFMDETGALNPDAVDALIEDEIQEENAGEEAPQADPATGLSETYEEELGLFRETLITGSYFYTNVPNGMITNSGVMLDLGEELDISVLKDGELYEYGKGNQFLEPGSYTVYISEGGIDYTVSYSENQTPEFHFRIVDGPVRDLEIFNVPKALALQTVSLDHNPIQTGGSFFRLEKDGVYTVVMEDEKGTVWESTIVKDTASPEFSVRTEKDTAFFSYASEDIEKVVVTKDGETREVPIIYELSGKGSYTADVYDFAGNVSSVSFRLSYSMNTAAIVSIILFLAAAFGAVFYLMRAKSKISVK